MTKDFNMLKRVLAVLAFVSVISSCATVPLTGRKQLNLVSNTEIIQASAAQYKNVLDSSRLSSNAEQVAMIKRVGQRIQTAVETYMKQKGLADQLAGFNWEFNLIQDDKTVNAWCMPGGKVAFYTGILPVCKDETGVAIVRPRSCPRNRQPWTRTYERSNGGQRAFDRPRRSHGTKPVVNTTAVDAIDRCRSQRRDAEIFTAG